MDVYVYVGAQINVRVCERTPQKSSHPIPLSLPPSRHCILQLFFDRRNLPSIYFSMHIFVCAPLPTYLYLYPCQSRYVMGKNPKTLEPIDTAVAEPDFAPDLAISLGPNLSSLPAVSIYLLLPLCIFVSIQ